MRKFLKKIPLLRAIVLKYRRMPRYWLVSNLPRQSVGAEIGVHEGNFTAMLLQRLSPQKIYLIDPWKCFEEEVYDKSFYGNTVGGQQIMDERYERVRGRFAEQEKAGVIQFERALSSEAVEKLQDGELDWVYIDGDHLYAAVMDDLEKYDAKVKPGGYIAGDDFGVVGWWENGVELAVRDYVKARPSYKLEVKGEQFLIKKPG